MVKPKGVVPTPEAWGKIVKAVRHSQRTRPVRKARRMPRRRALATSHVWEALLNSNLNVATNTLTGPSTATADLLIPDGSDLQAGPEITVTNRSLAFRASSGAYVAGIIVNGEYRVLFADCET